MKDKNQMKRLGLAICLVLSGVVSLVLYTPPVALANPSSVPDSGSTLTLEDTDLHHNGAYLGGAIYQTGSGASADVSNCLIHHNTVKYAHGEGMLLARNTPSGYPLYFKKNLSATRGDNSSLVAP